jgi:hypothetical protein
MNGLMRISLPHATFGLVVTNDLVSEAAPIARWAVGKSFWQVRDYYVGRGGYVEWTPE